MQRIQYPSLAAAVGAFVTGEMEACMAEPHRLMPDMGDRTEEERPLPGPFDMIKFEEHLSGLLSDLLEFCFDASYLEHKGPVVLLIAPGEEADTADREWQACAQGQARIEVAK